MDLFATKVQLSSSVTSAEVYSVIKQWLENSPHYKIKKLIIILAKKSFSKILLIQRRFIFWRLKQTAIIYLRCASSIKNRIIHGVRIACFPK